MATDLTGFAVITAALFPGKPKDNSAAMNTLETRIAELGGRVVATHVQRRGISGRRHGKPKRGGRATMHRPYSSRTLISPGKARELAVLRATHDADAVVFHNELTPHQRDVLSVLLGCRVLDRTDL